jgi:hypothetical protein
MARRDKTFVTSVSKTEHRKYNFSMTLPVYLDVIRRRLESGAIVGRRQGAQQLLVFPGLLRFVTRKLLPCVPL